MIVRELIEKLNNMHQESEVWMENAGESHHNDSTGFLWTDDAQIEDVKKFKEGVILTSY